MTRYDAIVIGAGHNGLAAAVLLQKAGLRTVCLDFKLYAGGMASTVELFDGYRFEIAGSVQFPTSTVVVEELGLDTLPTIDLDVMSVAVRGVGDDPLIQYSDPIKLFTHLNEVHGADAVNGMAGLMAWSQAPTRALGRFEAGTQPKTYDEMYACATNEFERSAIDDMLFGSVTDVLDRYLPDREKHGALRGSMTVLAVNTLYRGPATPGSAAALAFGLGVPDGDTMQMKKLRGGIGALTSHLGELLESHGGEVRLRTKVTEILVADGRVSGVRTEGGETLTAPIIVSGIAPDVTLNELIDPALLPGDIRERYARTDHRGSYLQMHFALEEAPEFAAPYEALNDPAMQASIGLFCTPEEVQQQWEDCRRGIVPADPTVVLQIPTQNDPDLAPAGKHAASAFALWFPIEGGADYGDAKVEMGQRVIDKITRLAPNFERSIIRHTTFTPKHMGVMFGAPGGDYCHGLLNPDQIGPNRPGPKGFSRPADSDRGAVPGQCGLPWRTGHHVHSRLQRGPTGARRAHGLTIRAARPAARRSKRPTATRATLPRNLSTTGVWRIPPDEQSAAFLHAPPSALSTGGSSADRALGCLNGQRMGAGARHIVLVAPVTRRPRQGPRGAGERRAETFSVVTTTDTRRTPTELMTTGWFTGLVPVTVDVGAELFEDAAHSAQTSFDSGIEFAIVPFDRVLELAPPEAGLGRPRPGNFVMSFLDASITPLSSVANSELNFRIYSPANRWAGTSRP